MQLDFLMLLVAEEKLDLSFSLQLGLARKLEQRGIPGKDGVLTVSVITGNYPAHILTKNPNCCASSTLTARVGQLSSSFCCLL